MQNRLRKELLVDINNFLEKLDFYVNDCDELEITELITLNEITRFFNNLKNCRKKA